MAKKLTASEKASKTREAKKLAGLKELGFERKKVKTKRKPMSEEQKKAAIERLAKAREARGADGSKSVHEDIRDLPEDHFLHWKKVKEWLKANQLQLKSMSSYKNSKVSKERADYIDLNTYITNMKKYLSGGIWCDFRYGEQREGRIQKVCIAMAYYSDGTAKRQYDTWYPDIAQVWTRELEEEFANDKEYANMYKREIHVPINNDNEEVDDET
jgi:hypothetical protein|tara:strand:- start:1360 stop:2001 length:642 start_codon:yes stop_codon:yes gene_type:complete